MDAAQFRSFLGSRMGLAVTLPFAVLGADLLWTHNRARRLRAGLPFPSRVPAAACVRTWTQPPPPQAGGYKMSTEFRALRAKPPAVSLATFLVILYLACLALA